MKQNRSHWGSRFGFVLAAAGSAVGLGNIWKFPYITGENGGGLFVLIYLACILLVGLPILVAEIMIGRAAQAQPVLAFKRLSGDRTPWSVVGWLGVISGFIILSFYVVVAGWAMDYTIKSVVGFTTPIAEKAEQTALVYRSTASSEEMQELIVDDMTRLSLDRAERDWRRQFPPMTWEQWLVAKKAMDEGADVDKIREHPEKAEAIDLVAAAEPPLDDIKNGIREKAEDTVKAMDPVAMRDKAETIHRRNTIRDEVSGVFVGLLQDGWTSTFWAALFMFITILVVATGISSGIERTCRVLMPLLVLCILTLVVYGLFQPGFGDAVAFVFKPDANALEPKGVLEALGHAFFTLSLGMGAMITYGSYQRSQSGGLLGQSVAIAGLDTVIAILACMMMFPIIFSYGQDPSGGPGLVFMSMPLAFAEMGELGMLLSIIFFGLLVFAALTSAISLLEVVASYLIDARNWSRMKACWILGGAIFGFGIITAFANSSGFKMVSWLPGYGQTFFDTMDLLTSNWMLPLGGLLIAIYAGWVMPARVRQAELSDLSGFWAGSWLFLIRFVAPILVIIVLLDKIGLIDVNDVFYRIMH
ncbi:MAG: sodium-dependent transporter [Phycisphaerales bacterium]|nr:sodium-dependent transporter [Phycisphaerales bacterium]